jgi:Tfp pilus assembly protein PilN
MRAVNLVPEDSRSGWRAAGARPSSPVYALLAGLAVAVVLVTAYVLAVNNISTQKAKIAALQNQAAQAQATAARLQPYVDFAQLAQQRVQTVRAIASSRFDWHAALSQLAQVVPANTSLSSLVGSVVPGATVAGAGGSGSATDVRGDEQAPAFQLSGCSDSQDDVARLMSRLRLIDGVTRVSFEDSSKAGGSSSTGAIGASGGCKPGSPTFDLVVFFAPLANAGADGVTSVGPENVSNTTTGGRP